MAGASSSRSSSRSSRCRLPTSAVSVGRRRSPSIGRPSVVRLYLPIQEGWSIAREGGERLTASPGDAVRRTFGPIVLVPENAESWMSATLGVPARAAREEATEAGWDLRLLEGAGPGFRLGAFYRFIDHAAAAIVDAPCVAAFAPYRD